MTVLYRAVIAAVLMAVSWCVSSLEPAWSAARLTDLSALPAHTRCSTTALPDPGLVGAVEPRLASWRSKSGRPKRLVGVWIQNDGLWIGSAHSDNGGLSWKSSIPPFTRCAQGGLPFSQAVDPWVSLGPDGSIYVSALASLWANGAQGPFQVASAVVASESSNGGATWRRTRIVDVLRDPQGLPVIDDKPTLLADNHLKGRAYLVWHRATPEGATAGMFSSTKDGGRHWSVPTTIAAEELDGTSASWHQLLQDPKTGKISDIFNWVRPAGSGYESFVALVQSKDHGATWSRPIQISEDRAIGIVAAPGGFVTVGTGIDSAIDPRDGTMYVAWTDARFTSLTHDDVVIARSSDHGKTWSDPTRVSQAATAFDPSIAINSHGEVGVSYYDLRTTDPSGMSIPVSSWFVRSSNRGATFGPERSLTQAFDVKVAPYIGGYFLGDYQGIAGLTTRFQVLFAAPGRDGYIAAFTTNVR